LPNGGIDDARPSASDQLAFAIGDLSFHRYGQRAGAVEHWVARCFSSVSRMGVGRVGRRMLS
jgi:hypothetical protein